MTKVSQTIRALTSGDSVREVRVPGRIPEEKVLTGSVELALIHLFGMRIGHEHTPTSEMVSRQLTHWSSNTVKPYLHHWPRIAVNVRMLQE